MYNSDRLTPSPSGMRGSQMLDPEFNEAARTTDQGFGSLPPGSVDPHISYFGTKVGLRRNIGH